MTGITVAERLLVDSDGRPLDAVCGAETEYVAHQAGDPFSRWTTTARTVRGPREYGEAGQREYIDLGNHPEYATAETTNYLQCGHLALCGHIQTARQHANAATLLLRRLGRSPELKRKDFHLHANTCDPYGQSWGRHNNVLAARGLPLAAIKAALIPLRVSRIVFTGVGVPMLDEASGYSFHLSEKASFIEEVASAATTKNRPIYNTRDRPHAYEERYRRIHDTCDETGFSPIANALRPATTALVLRAAGLGANFEDLMPDNPVAAMHAISADSSLCQKIRTAGGKDYTGIEHSRAIAERSIDKAQKAGMMTDQDGLYAGHWLRVLDRLETDPEGCNRLVDWVLKRQLIDRDRARGLGPEETVIGRAWAKSLQYHRLLPEEGLGMRLLRKGFFEQSPDMTLIDAGLPAPNDTHACVRASAISRLAKIKLPIKPSYSWSHIQFWWSGGRITLDMSDPYDTDLTKVDSFMDDVKRSLNDMQGWQR